MSNLLLLQAKVFSDAQKNVHLLSTSRYLICLKYNSNFACNLSENCRLQLCAFLTSHSQKKTYSFIFLRQILIRYNLKMSFSKLVKVLVLVLELFYGTRTRVHFSISVLVLVLEVFCGTRTRTRKLSTRLHHWFRLSHLEWSFRTVVIIKVLYITLTTSKFRLAHFTSSFFLSFVVWPQS